MHYLLRTFLAVLLFCTVPLYCQSFLNIRCTDGCDKNLLLASFQRMTFDETAGNVNFLMTDASTQTLAFSAIQKMTTGDVGSGSPLPVELVTFFASVTQNKVALSWHTATEVNNYGFEVERRNVVESTSGGVIEWKKIGFVAGNGTSNSPHEYSFTDQAFAGGRYAYRLRQIDNSGTFIYSQEVEISLGIPSAYSLRQNYPNPFNPTTTIEYDIPNGGIVTLGVYDIVGREVAILVNETKEAGSYTITFDGSRLASGVYFCRMSSSAYSHVTKMIIVQ